MSLFLTIISLIVKTFVVTVFFSDPIKNQNTCETPNKTSGKCVLITECPHLFELLKERPLLEENRRFLVQSKCGSEGQTPKICCDNSKKQQNEENHENECQTPIGMPGDCVPIHQCVRWYAVVKSRNISNDEGKYLRAAQCGFVGKTEPKICCSREVNVTMMALPLSMKALDVPPYSSDEIKEKETRLLEKEICGIDTLASKIIGGETVKLKEFPWVALLQYSSGRFGCGGSLISKRYVITAAHCTKGVVMKSLGNIVGVILGEYDTTMEIDCLPNQGCNNPVLKINVSKIIPHEHWNEMDPNHYDDIALLRLANDVTFSETIRPICINKDPIVSENEVKIVGKTLPLFVSGWGRTENGFGSSIKLKLKLPFFDADDCQQAYKKARTTVVLDKNKQICAGGISGKDSCRGDSGGPLMMIDSKDASGEPRWYQTGIVSFGPSMCGVSGIPGIYSQISTYYNWILENLEP